MAEKEEYIVISKKDFDYKKGHYVTHLAKQMTRTEAINRMAKALAFAQAKTFVDKDQWEIVMRGCRFEAKAALNALLEGK